MDERNQLEFQSLNGIRYGYVMLALCALIGGVIAVLSLFTYPHRTFIMWTYPLIWFCGFYCLFCVTAPWSLKIDTIARKYNLRSGYWPLIKYRQGSLYDINGIRLFKNFRHNKNSIYFVAFIFTNEKKHYIIHKFADRIEAASEGQHLALELGLPCITRLQWRNNQWTNATIFDPSATSDIYF